MEVREFVFFYGISISPVFRLTEPQKCWIFPYGPLPTIFDLRFRECPGNYEGGVAGVVVLALVAFVIFGVFCYCFNCIYRCDCSGGKKDY